MERILIATDAWHPQVNGVVRTLTNLCDELVSRGHELMVVSPSDFRTMPCPTYPEIRLSFATARHFEHKIHEFRPTTIHIATEGPIGHAARRAAIRHDVPFITSFHTRFPEYVRARAPVPERLSYALLRRFHKPAAAVLVPTEAIREKLAARGFGHLVKWARGVDREIFKPSEPIELDLPRPIFLTVSRIATEKNIQAFLDLDLPGSKVVVGDGPMLAEFRRRYPSVHFAGLQEGEDLARHYALADVFVFPSKTDTFGIVLLEALACGVPIAAFPEPGPVEVVGNTAAGAISEDLREACLAALKLDRQDALTRSGMFSWATCADIYLDTLHASRGDRWEEAPLEAVVSPEAVPAHGPESAIEALR